MIELTDKNFHENTRNGIVLVDFWAPWCSSCLKLMPILEEIEKEHKKIKFAKLNSSDHMETARKFNVMSLPTAVILKDGNEIGRINGYLPKENFVGQITSIVK